MPWRVLQQDAMQAPYHTAMQQVGMLSLVLFQSKYVMGAGIRCSWSRRGPQMLREGCVCSHDVHTNLLCLVHIQGEIVVRSPHGQVAHRAPISALM